MKRVVITGLGAVTPIGNSVNEMWSSVRAGKCGIDRITLFDTTGCNVKIAAEVKGFQPGKYLKPLEQKKIDRFSQIAILASHEAYDDAGLDKAEFDRNRFSVMFGSGFGGGTIGQEYAKILTEGYDTVSKMTVPFNLANMAASNVAIQLKAYGTCTPVITACATGTDCVGRAFRDIKHGYTDIALAGAAEATINPVLIAGFSALGALTACEDLNRASIPFDGERSGFVMGEGAGSIIMEEYEHAMARKAKIYAEIVAYGTSCDAFNLVSPDLSLIQGSRAMQEALEEASLSVEDIDYINAHGTSTQLNDSYETALIKKVFGEYSKQLAVSSTKSMTGHLLGAAGAVEAIMCVKALQDGFIPPTLNYQVPDDECDLDYVANEGRESLIEHALSNSLGFGGHNSVLIIKKYKEV